MPSPEREAALKKMLRRKKSIERMGGSKTSPSVPSSTAAAARRQKSIEMLTGTLTLIQRGITPTRRPPSAADATNDRTATPPRSGAGTLTMTQRGVVPPARQPGAADATAPRTLSASEQDALGAVRIPRSALMCRVSLHFSTRTSCAGE